MRKNNSTFIKSLLLSMLVITSCGTEESTFQQSSQKQPLTEEMRSERRQARADAKGIMTYSFIAGSVESTTINFDPNLAKFTQDLTLRREPDTVLTYTQIERTLTQLNFTQGHTGNLASQEFEALQAGKVDILLVVDDSATMTPIQAGLSTALPELLEHIDNLNWQIAVNTTSSGCLKSTSKGTQILTKEQYDLDPTALIDDYKELVQVGNTGNNLEKGIESAGDAMTGKCKVSDKKGGFEWQEFEWRREDAKPVVLIVSDEKNCGSDPTREGCAGEPYETGTYLTSQVPDVRVYALLLLTQYADGCPDIGGYDDFYPQNYVDLVNNTGGIFDDICQDSYATVMRNISQDVSKQVVRKFLLQHEPSTPPKLEVDGTPINNKFELQGKLLEMKEDLPNNSGILKVTYKHSPIEKKKDFPLKGKVDQGTLNIEVDGQPLDTSKFTFQQEGNKLTFSEMPADHAKIAIKYRQANKPLIKTFAYSGNPLPETMRVMVGDKEYEDFTLNQEKNEIVMTTPAPDGAPITITYEPSGIRTLRYDMAQVGGRAVQKMTVIDAEDGRSIPATLEENQLVFPRLEVIEGRQVKVSYDVIYTEEDLFFKVPLPMTPLEDSLEILTEDQGANCTTTDPNISDGFLYIQCLEGNFNQMNISFKYAHNYRSSFKLESVPEFSSMKVYVDGKPLEIYEFSEDGEITINPSDLKPGAQVKLLIAP